MTKNLSCVFQIHKYCNILLLNCQVDNDDELSKLNIHAIKRKNSIAVSLEDFIKIVGAKFVTNKDEETLKLSSKSISFASFKGLLKV